MKKDLEFFTYDDELFVYSHVTYALYGFKGFYAALFLFLQMNSDKKDIVNFINDAGAKLDDAMSELITMMQEIIESKQKDEEPSQKLEFLHLSVISKSKQTIECMLGTWHFLLGFDEGHILEILQEHFQHLFVRNAQKKDDTLLVIDIQQDKNSFKIEVNGEKVKEIRTLKHLIPALQDVIRMAYYHNIDYLIALHAAALSYKKRVLILPGVSGSGKSTLSTYLMHHGFELFSDELTVIKKDETLVPLPFAVSIKEGSWSVVSEFVEEFSSMQSALRFDEQMIKTLQPTKMAEDDISIINGCIIFPTYKASSDLLLSEIGIIEALELINKAKYHINSAQDVKQIEAWLNILRSCKIYKLTYDKLSEAKKIIKEVMNHE